jgi:ABC-2 type transport system permease protein
MRRFFVLLKKELRELITAQMLVPFVIVIVMFFGLGQMLGAANDSTKDGFPVVVYDQDSSTASGLVVKALNASGFKVTLASGSTADADKRARSLAQGEGNIVVAIPVGFERGLADGKRQEVQTWAVVRSFSFMGSQDVSSLNSALAAVNQAIAGQVAVEAAPSVSPEMLQQPVKVVEHVVVGSKQAASSVDTVMGFVAQQTTFIPIVLFIVIIFAAQMIATAIATEKENKTLETLLSYPISRASLVTAKMVAAGLVALASAGVYMAGMRSYMTGIEKGLAGEGASARAAAASEAVMRQLGLTFGPTDYVMLGLSLFAGILVALSMAIILGAFAESVKSVQALLTPLMVLLLIPYFLTLFLDIDQLPTVLRWVVMAIPFTYPFLAGPNLFLGNEAAVWFGIAYQLVWFGALVAVAARIFSSDRILTMKLSLGRKKRTSSANGRGTG